jgi:hypothetical protein
LGIKCQGKNYGIGAVKMKKRADFNTKEAYELWQKGWCYRALGEKYGYSRGTIKKYIHLEMEITKQFGGVKKADAVEAHRINHGLHCPLCEQPVKEDNRVKLF